MLLVDAGYLMVYSSMVAGKSPNLWIPGVETNKKMNWFEIYRQDAVEYGRREFRDPM